MDNRQHPKKKPRKVRLVLGNHLMVTLGAMIVSVTVGFVLVSLYARYLPSEEPHAVLSMQPAGIGRIEVIRMPVGARRLRDVKRFVITGGGFDDFGRIYINNYLINTSEDRERVLIGDFKNDPLAIEFLTRNPVRIRNNEIPVPKDVKNFLRVGTNFIVYELINARGACSSGLDVAVNGVELEGFPQQFPTKDFSPDVDSLPEALELKLGSEDALCARWIYEFILY
jgi:hypothetical protein